MTSIAKFKGLFKSKHKDKRPAKNELLIDAAAAVEHEVNNAFMDILKGMTKTSMENIEEKKAVKKKKATKKKKEK